MRVAHLSGNDQRIIERVDQRPALCLNQPHRLSLRLVIAFAMQHDLAPVLPALQPAAAVRGCSGRNSGSEDGGSSGDFDADCGYCGVMRWQWGCELRHASSAPHRP